MKKNDKIVVVLGVIILVLASIGVFYYDVDSTKAGKIEIENFSKITGAYKESFEKMSITVSDSDPFYALIATPLAIHYDNEGEQELMPLYIENMTNPSNAIKKLQNIHLLNYENCYFEDLEYDNAKDFSLIIAEEYWKNSPAALVIEDSKEGFFIGVNAVPIASYLSIPIIVCDEIDGEVAGVLNNLEVEKIIVCGTNIDGYQENYEYLTFENPDQAVENTSNVVKEKFGDVEYISMTNPIDAWLPKVEDSVEFYFEDTVKTTSKINIARNIKNSVVGKTESWRFTIPEDYKYALVKFEGVNHEIDGIDEFGDAAGFKFTTLLEGENINDEELGHLSTAYGIPERDEKGNILKDKVYAERVLYDRGGVTFDIGHSGSWATKDQGKVSAKVIVEKLEHPVYPMMKKLSLVAPYLASSHKGIVFGKESFAFTADDDVLTDEGETLPGFYLPGRNALLFPLSNKHVYDNIHQPLNELLAKLAGITYKQKTDVKVLQKHYMNNPVYIAVVGGHTVLPQYYYQNHVEPLGDYDGDGIDDTGIGYFFGGSGTPSDIMFGNIDPVEYEWSNDAQDICTEHPKVENIVGRITGWDVQDANAIVLRSLFYRDIIENYNEWKDNYGLMIGGGLDFQRPLLLHILSKTPILNNILAMVPMTDLVVGPWKYDTGFTDILIENMEKNIGEELDFDVTVSSYSEAMAEGYSDEALQEIKQAGLFNKLFFKIDPVEKLAGKTSVNGADVMESSNFLFVSGHGAQHHFGMDGIDLVSSGFYGFLNILPWKNIFKKFVPLLMGGFFGPGAGIGNLGSYNPRSVSEIDIGPSFMWLESCFCGKFDGLYPEANIGQAFVHSGVSGLVASTTGSNIPGGYLEPKNKLYDTPFSVNKAKRQANKNAEKGIYPDFHFGTRVYKEMCFELTDKDATLGLALRNARNNYLVPDELDWELWWSPPLIDTDDAEMNAMVYNEIMSNAPSGIGTHIKSKYTTYQEYVLFGDPAFNPYEPENK